MGRPAEFAPFNQRTRQRVGRKRVLPTESDGIVVEEIVALYAERDVGRSRRRHGWPGRGGRGCQVEAGIRPARVFLVVAIEERGR
jgi:hypothetical protein